MHDWHASVAAGWDPESDKPPTYSYGDLAVSVMQQESFFQALFDRISTSEYSYLLNPLVNVAEPDIFPEVVHPIEEEMVFVNPLTRKETGLYPKAALWQSGWENSMPYLFVRAQVYERLLNVAKIFQSVDPSLSLCITDGWRSHAQQLELFNSFYIDGYVPGDPRYVAEPSDDDRLAAPHPAGGAIDVMLGIDDQAFWIGSPLDWMNVEAHADYFENSDSIFLRDMRRFFINAFCDVGFVSIDAEWWHFEYGTRRWAGKVKSEPLYGNAYVDTAIYSDLEPVELVPRSRRAAMS